MARESLYKLGKPGDKVLLEGTLIYSALKEKRKPSRPSDFDNEPKYRITIADPKVVKGGDTELGKHILDTDISHGAYESKSGKNAGKLIWGFASNSKFPIEIYAKDTGSNHLPADQFLEKELAPDQKVGILFSLYEGKRPGSGAYVSGSLDGVVVEDSNNVKYFSSTGTDYSDFLGAPKGELKPAANANESAGEESSTPADDSADDAALKDKADELF